eukprot:NODE_30_length_37342_cov_0.449507.p10 type:complete len:368 gc:universal NODE_30_length_37342_cov_0.449507:15985-17088(+)
MNFFQDAIIFEGAEKLLEIQLNQNSVFNLRQIMDWQDMLLEANCTIISSISGDTTDAYVLSESSLFVSEHKLIVKTCGCTTLLKILPKFLSIAYFLGYNEMQLFYSRKCYLAPELQVEMHTNWDNEVAYLDNFLNGSAYTFGSTNKSHHWYLYASEWINIKDIPNILKKQYLIKSPRLTSLPNRQPGDQTLEILMTHLDIDACRQFYYPRHDSSIDLLEADIKNPQHETIRKLVDNLKPTNHIMDGYSFKPCGFSSNHLLQYPYQEYYCTLHITPEAHCSYASLETNVHTDVLEGSSLCESYTSESDDLHANLIKKTLDLFKPKEVIITWFCDRMTSLDICTDYKVVDVVESIVKTHQVTYISLQRE